MVGRAVNLRHAILLWQRGYVTKTELHTLLRELGIDRRFWRDVELEWRGSNRMLSWFRYPDEATAALEAPAGPIRPDQWANAR